MKEERPELKAEGYNVRFQLLNTYERDFIQTECLNAYYALKYGIKSPFNSVTTFLYIIKGLSNSDNRLVAYRNSEVPVQLLVKLDAIIKLTNVLITARFNTKLFRCSKTDSLFVGQM